MLGKVNGTGTSLSRPPAAALCDLRLTIQLPSIRSNNQECTKGQCEGLVVLSFDDTDPGMRMMLRIEARSQSNGTRPTGTSLK